MRAPSYSLRTHIVVPLGAKSLSKPGRAHDDSSIKRLVEHSEDSTPPLTPLSSESGDLPFGNSHNVPRKSYQKELRDVKRTAVTKKDARLSRGSAYSTKERVEFWRDDRSPTPFSSSSSSEDEAAQTALLSKKRKRVSEHGQTAEERAAGRKRKHGWKGWVVVEGSPPPIDTLIKLDEPKVLVARTRSGKVGEPRPMIAIPRRRRTLKLAMTKSPSAAPQTPSLIGDVPPSVLDSRPASVGDGDGSEAAVERVTLVQDTQEPWYVGITNHGSAHCRSQSLTDPTRSCRALSVSQVTYTSSAHILFSISLKVFSVCVAKRAVPTRTSLARSCFVLGRN